MSHILISAAAGRRTETLAAIMTTLASPGLSASDGISLWRVDMNAGATGPLHRIDAQQIWTLLTGHASWLVADERYDLAAGDTIQVPADVERSVSAITPVTFLVCGRSDALASSAAMNKPVTPPWLV